MKARTLFLALVAVLSVLSATAVAEGHRVVQGTKSADELNMTDGGDRVFARSGDDTVEGGGRQRPPSWRTRRRRPVRRRREGPPPRRPGQRSPGRRRGQRLPERSRRRPRQGRIVCGDGYDTSCSAGATWFSSRSGGGRRARRRAEGRPGARAARSADDDGCEKVNGRVAASTRARRPTAAARSRRARDSGCDEPACPSMSRGCDDPVEDPCAATYRDCEDPVVDDQEPDTPVDEPAGEPDQT